MAAAPDGTGAAARERAGCARAWRLGGRPNGLSGRGCGGGDSEALEGLALATVWLDDERATLDALERSYSLYRQAGDRLGAARTALWLGLCSQYIRGQWAVASGWLGRAERLLDGLEPASEHALLAVWRGHFALLADHDLPEARRPGRPRPSRSAVGSATTRSRRTPARSRGSSS